MKMKKYWMILLMTWMSAAFSEALVTKVIELNTISVEKVQSVMTPFLKDDEKIGGSGQTLLVKLYPDTLKQLRILLHDMDKSQSMLRISIHQGPPQEGNSVIYSTSSKATQELSQSVNVMDGESAFIATEESKPIVTGGNFGGSVFSSDGGISAGNRAKNRPIDPNNGNVNAGELWGGVNYEQKTTQKGFNVQAWLQGEQVKVKIERTREQENAQLQNTQQYQGQYLNTVVLIPLNKWVALGSSLDADKAKTQSETASAGNIYSNTATLYIKVNKVNF